MREQPVFRLARHASLVLFAASAPFAVAADAPPVARVDFATGAVNATGADGRQRPLTKGATVESGDTITTVGNGRAHLRFSDGSYTALQPDTQFRIDEYRFQGVADGEERGFFSLLKGGLRTITGAIGRTNKSTYRVSTSTATIGIRGTEYLAQVTNSLELSVGGGTAEVHTQEATPRVFLIREGSSAFLASPSAPLQFLETGLFMPPPPAATPAKQGSQPPTAPGQSDSTTTGLPVVPPTFTAGDVRAPDGSSAFVTNLGRPGFAPGAYTGMAALSATATPHAPGTAVDTHTVTSECDRSSCSGAPNSIVTFDSQGYKRIDCGAGCFIDRSAATVAEVGSVAGVIEWGKWVGGPITAGGFYNNLTFGANQGLHYVVGVPASPMPTTGTGTFTLLGATIPTFSDGAGGGLGTGALTAATAAVNFGTGAAATNMTLVFPGGNYTLQTNGGFSPGTTGVFGSGTMTFNSGSVNVCSSSCPAQMAGFFAGPNATHFGTVYHALSNTSAPRFAINGSAVLKR